jgi:hypothetical protein
VIDRSVATSVLGTIGSFTLEGIHLVLASICAVLTAVHALYSIYLKHKGKGKK